MNSSLEVTDRDAAAVAAEPRVSLVDIEASIEYVFYRTADEVVGKADDATLYKLSILTICLIVMKNGFVVVGKSAPASPANFNAELGRKFAYEDAIRQLWPLMGFALKNRLHQLKLAEDDEIPF